MPLANYPQGPTVTDDKANGRLYLGFHEGTRITPIAMFYYANPTERTKALMLCELCVTFYKGEERIAEPQV